MTGRRAGCDSAGGRRWTKLGADLTPTADPIPTRAGPGVAQLPGLHPPVDGWDRRRRKGQSGRR